MQLEVRPTYFRRNVVGIQLIKEGKCLPLSLQFIKSTDSGAALIFDFIQFGDIS